MSALEERKKYSVTKGQYNALKRGPSARSCSSEECSYSIPKYVGRYPSSCGDCGGELAVPSVENAVEAITKGKPVETVVDSLMKPLSKKK